MKTELLNTAADLGIRAFLRVDARNPQLANFITIPLPFYLPVYPGAIAEEAGARARLFPNDP